MEGVNGKIEGIEIVRLKKIPDERGTIYHMLKSNDPHYEQFGEIYFSTIHPGAIKAWHIHSEMTLNYAVIEGMIKLVLYDAREGSKTKGNIMEIFMGEENYILVKIPPEIHNGFKGVGGVTAIVANCSTHPHKKDEIRREDPFSKDIPYDWDMKHG